MKLLFTFVAVMGCEMARYSPGVWLIWHSLLGTIRATVLYGFPLHYGGQQTVSTVLR
jgi:hypothetical protein